MKVLHINCNYIGTALHRLMIRRLRLTGGEHCVFVPSDGRAVWKNFIPEEDEVVSECFRRFHRYLYFIKQRRIIHAAEQAYDISRFDLIHAYTLFTDGNTAMKLARKYGKPFVVAVRNTDVNGFFKRRWLLWPRGWKVLRRAEQVFFLSEGYREKTMRYLPRSLQNEVLGKSRIIPNGIDDFWLGQPAPAKTEEDLARIEGGTCRFLFVGRIIRWKNPLAAADAVEKLRLRGYNVTLTAVGRTEEPSLQDELQKRGVRYIPQVGKEELMKIYRNHDIFLLPSTDETFGLVYPEAMSQGLPVLYSKNEGFDGNFPDGEVGYAVDPHDPENIAEMAEKTMENYREISARCPGLAGRFRWADIVDIYQEIYRGLADL